MGKILLYKAGRACQSYLANSNVIGSNYIEVHPYKDINGNEHNNLYQNSGLSNFKQNAMFYDGLTGYVSADTEEDFSLDHYTAREIASIGYSNTSANQTGGKIYTIQATNNGSAEVSVGSIKFTKTIKDGTSANITCLLWGYFLDTPVTIGVGETKTFAINIDS